MLSEKHKDKTKTYFLKRLTDIVGDACTKRDSSLRYCNFMTKCPLKQDVELICPFSFVLLVFDSSSDEDEFL